MIENDNNSANQIKQKNKLKTFLYLIWGTAFRKTPNTYVQFVKYVTLGSVSHVVDFGSLYLLTKYLHIYYIISVAVGFIGGVLTNYLISILWIFDRSSYKLHVEIMLIFIISGIGLLITEIIIYALVEYASLHYILSKAVAATVVVFWNFYCRKKFIFKTGSSL